jgi:c(7)-type cytochrome triheme protein
MEEIYAGRLCGVCHNGKRAFSPAGNCNRCHIKP